MPPVPPIFAGLARVGTTMADAPADFGDAHAPEQGSAAGPPQKKQRRLKAHVFEGVGQTSVGSGMSDVGEACTVVGKSVAVVGMRLLEATHGQLQGFSY